MERIYLDNCATTPVHAEVMAEMMKFFGHHYGNPSSKHHFGDVARKALETARQRVASLLGAEPEEIIFTSGGTEADNLAIIGTALAAFQEKKHLVVSAVEHPAVMNAARFLTRFGVKLTILPVDGQGRVKLERMAEIIDEDTFLVSVIHGQNETGVIEPLDVICTIAHERGIPVHTDAVQSIGKVPFDLKDCPVDLLSLSAHKMYGPKGVGALFIRKDTPVLPITFGGGQEGGWRSGTENVAGIVGLGAACNKARRDLGAFMNHTERLRSIFEGGIKDALPVVKILADEAPRLPHVSAICFPGISGQKLAVMLDKEGIAVSAGAACHSGAEIPSHVLQAMGLPEEYLSGLVRFSFGWFNTKEEVERAISTVKRLVEKMS
jgi:cysteine desulfurase